MDVILKTRSGTCFPAGTSVRMADGSNKPIEGVRVGDTVVSGIFHERRITSTSTRSYTGDMIGLNIRGVEGPLVCTADHQIATLRNDKIGLQWERAGNLTEGMPAFHHGGNTPIYRIKRNPVQNLHVYDIEVENDHCFLANGVTVHNCGDGEELMAVIRAEGHEYPLLVLWGSPGGDRLFALLPDSSGNYQELVQGEGYRIIPGDYPPDDRSLAMIAEFHGNPSVILWCDKKDGVHRDRLSILAGSSYQETIPGVVLRFTGVIEKMA